MNIFAAVKTQFPEARPREDVRVDKTGIVFWNTATLGAKPDYAELEKWDMEAKAKAKKNAANRAALKDLASKLDSDSQTAIDMGEAIRLIVDRLT